MILQRATRRGLFCAWMTLALGALAASLGWTQAGQPPAPEAAAESPPAAISAEDVTFFESKIRPLLIQHCYECHSAKSEVVEGGLRLDHRAGWQKGGELGPAIVPGKPEESLLLTAVKYQDDALEMPPAGALPAEDVALLEEWIRRGAPDPRERESEASAPVAIDLETGRKHWAFQPLSDTAPPTTGNTDWAHSPLDAFLVAELEARGLQPQAPAGPAVRLRRLWLSVTGLPPTPRETSAFLNDTEPDAYDRQVDRVLAAPAYGERFARHWLDLARFAESHGFEHDYDRPTAYAFRDFVVQAFNQDLPYNTFARWQLAGDEISPEDPLALMATGFLAAGVHSTQITKNQVEKERYDELDDIVATTSTAFLGLTLGCARCHDHKFDPISTRDYYQVVANFTKAVRSEVDVNLDPVGYAQALSTFEQEHGALTAALQQYADTSLADKLDAALAAPTEPPADQVWDILELHSAVSSGGATLSLQEDGSLVATGANPDFDSYTLVAVTHQPVITGIRIEALAMDGLVARGPGRADNGNFDLTHLELTAEPLDGSAPPVKVALTNPRATFEQAGLPIAAAIDGDSKSGWAVDPEFGKDHAAAFDLMTPLGSLLGTKLTLKLSFDGNTRHSIAKTRWAITSQTGAAPGAPAGPQHLKEFYFLAQSVKAGQTIDRRLLLIALGPVDPTWKSLQQKVAEHESARPSPRLTKILVTSEGLPAVRLHTQGEDFLPATHYLERGNPNRKLEVAEPGYLSVLMPDSAQAKQTWQEPPPEGWRTTYQRRGLANWLTDTEYGAGGLLARVIANRLWQHHLGRGIVATPSDFGTQGEPPTHPDLLDFLASRLLSKDWHLKSLHRQILKSAAFQQGSSLNPAAQAADPGNMLLWRWQPRRLEGEAIRDAILAASNVLDRQMYGPGTLDGNSRRRSIYFTVKRSQLIPMMVLFDGPDALQGIAQRPRTTVAPQALMLLNHVFVREAARRVAASIPLEPAIATSNDPGLWHGAVQSAYSAILNRPADDTELAAAASFLASQAQSYSQSGDAAAGQTAVADLCQVLFDLNEFAYVE